MPVTNQPLLAVVTRVRVRAWYILPAFVWTTRKVQSQARTSEGNLSTTLRTTAFLTFWTLTTWQDDRSLRRFVSGGAHGAIMRRASDWFDEASIARWPITTATSSPSWEEAEAALETHGRLITVRLPSEAQRLGLRLGSSRSSTTS